MKKPIALILLLTILTSCATVETFTVVPVLEPDCEIPSSKSDWYCLTDDCYHYVLSQEHINKIKRKMLALEDCIGDWQAVVRAHNKKALRE